MSEYKLICGDCLEYMKTMDAGSVDAVVTEIEVRQIHQGG